ncbi:MAG: methionine synthase [Negativicutes bacterium]|nr:methionine synthase [Negativicutes bacterium]
MPSYYPPLTQINKEETRRYAGLRENATFPEEMLEQACAEALLLVKPRGCWQQYRYEASTGSILAPTPLRLVGDTILKHLAGAAEIAVIAVSIGLELEDAVASHFKAGDYTAGLLLDAAGTAAVEAAADAVNGLISAQAARQGLHSLFRYSPGYGSWDITAQPQVLSLSDGHTIDISVTPSCMLLPRKSMTAVIGLQAANTQSINTGCLPDGCKNCSQINCLSRKESP